jgi:hypothetical protein
MFCVSQYPKSVSKKKVTNKSHLRSFANAQTDPSCSKAQLSKNDLKKFLFISANVNLGEY